jgi:hypothetical protein
MSDLSPFMHLQNASKPSKLYLELLKVCRKDSPTRKPRKPPVMKRNTR